MKRNGLVFVPREPPKRVILYPTQDSTSQQQLQQPNGFANRAKTALVTTNHQDIQSPANNNVRPSRQAPFSSPPNGAPKSTEKPGNEGLIPNGSVSTAPVNGFQKVSNSYQANPYFRPKVVTNQVQPSTTTNNANLPPPPPSRDSSIATTNVTLQTLTSGSTTITTRGRPSITLRPPNPPIPSNGRTQESETTVEPSSAQEDNRRWAHNVASAPIVRRMTTSDERPSITSKLSETNIPNSISNDLMKPKGASATDIVISLMDTWRAPINPTGPSAINLFTRAGMTRDDSAIPGQTLATGEQVPNTPPFLTIGVSSAASNNNQNWKKALVANFQKNSRNNPSAKLFTSKQTAAPPQVPVPITNDTAVNPPSKPERTMILNGMYNERTFQLTENTPTIPSLIRKSTESLRVAKQDNNANSNIERSTSLQIPSSAYTNPVAVTTADNKTEEIVQQKENSNPETTPHASLPIPTALITAKPPANVEQQRAIITRVMIRRDFVKSTESKPAMPIAANFRSFIPPQSAKPGGLPINNAVQAANVVDNNTISTSNMAPNRIYPFQQSQTQQHYYHQQQQQQIPLSQKSLLSYTSVNPTGKDSVKTENNQQPANGLVNDSFTSSSVLKGQQTSSVSSTGAVIRSNSLSAANAESRRKREELVSKMKKRATSASAVSNDG